VYRSDDGTDVVVAEFDGDTWAWLGFSMCVFCDRDGKVSL
jgi:phenylpyruvate tautomerase PptA (4-oxalocrotonate tautomerase family)